MNGKNYISVTCFQLLMSSKLIGLRLSPFDKVGKWEIIDSGTNHLSVGFVYSEAKNRDIRWDHPFFSTLSDWVAAASFVNTFTPHPEPCKGNRYGNGRVADQALSWTDKEENTETDA